MNEQRNYFTIERVEFRDYTDKKGTRWIESIRPYDETEYHYACQLAGNNKNYWHICRNGNYLFSIYGASITPEEVAKRLLLEDDAAHLSPRICHN